MVGKFIIHFDPALFKEGLTGAILAFFSLYFLLYVMLVLSIFQARSEESARKR